ncbi:uncharacterized protein LOC133927529 [Phragmites australis]|uniref:uncharacterized protein LOC133927529 n=1 Tax=Phragmites australis TaxID=29695 RepID=UPI002D76EF4F|nr:uncharacterized protein LOC133927529 [Phragmites australis]
MEFFPDGIHVRLRNRVHGMYLHADELWVGISLSPRRASVNAAWQMHRVVRDGTTYVLLHSAAYGRYLAVSPHQSPPGHRGHCAIQRSYDVPEQDDVIWEAVRAGDGDDHVLVRHVSNRFLRANGWYRPWYTGVTVDNYDNLSFTMMHWMVEAIPPETGAASPSTSNSDHSQDWISGSEHFVLVTSASRVPDMFIQLPVFSARFGFLNTSVPLQQHPAILYGRFRGQTEVVRLQRVWGILYVRADDFGNIDQLGWRMFQFYGRSVFRLRLEVARLEGIFFNITLCVRAGDYGRLTPLVVDLPFHERVMEIVVLTTGTPAAEELRHPDVDAP